MYAILDIETTGGKYNEEGITEIAIYRFDGHKVVDQFISLINPEQPIQPFVVGLTGINNEMLRNAPKFFEVAKRIVEITEDCILVAHNAQFDNRILRLEFRRLGFDYDRRTLCTVELAKILIPGQVSYSLGKLVRALGIPLSDRHRASGDALATVKLFKMLLVKDVEKNILKESVKTEPILNLDTRIVRILEELPSITGVYYLHDEKGDIIFIGKSKNIRKRVNQHFTSDHNRLKEIRKEIASVSYEATGNELVAMLKENEEIKHNKPKFNRSNNKNIFKYALYQHTDEEGYINLKIARADARKKNIMTFTNLQQANGVLQQILETYRLCNKLTGLHKGNGSCFSYTIKSCNGACIGAETVEEYNLRVREMVETYSYEDQNMLVIDRGRDIDEKSALLVEDGEFKGIGYFNLNYQLNNLDIVRSIITPMKNDGDVRHIIQNYLRRNKKLKIIQFSTYE
ncbi:MAG TPA: exonuclease domain-containing protein [Gillisia sp.]|nr:exonuclease domain-containing protein [Gillisia sp.]